MKKRPIIGILREKNNHWERRAPLTPGDVRWLTEKGVSVEVESSPFRGFADDEYSEAGAKVVKKAEIASLLLGIKQPRLEDLLDDKIYMVFSHTIKGQPGSMPLLREFLKKHATLIDYEKVTDPDGRRLVYFGRFAGICGMADGLHYAGRKLQWKGIDNPFMGIDPAWKYGSLEDLKKDVAKAGRRIRNKGLSGGITPFIIGVTGCGNVSKGAQELMAELDPVEIHPRDLESFIKKRKYSANEIYKVVIFREEKFRAKDKKGFYFEEYLEHPGRFESNLDRYLPRLNMLIHTSYWDSRYPRVVPKDMLRELSGKKDFRLEFIADISCDIGGSIEVTDRATTQDNAVFSYNPRKDEYVDGYENQGISILAVDNLPAELPKEASENFSGMIRDYVYQTALHGMNGTIDDAAIPGEIRRAVITQGGRLTGDYQYLEEYLD